MCLIACYTSALGAGFSGPENPDHVNMLQRTSTNAKLINRRGHEGMDQPPASPASRAWQRHEGDTGSVQQGAIAFSHSFLPIVLHRAS